MKKSLIFLLGILFFCVSSLPALAQTPPLYPWHQVYDEADLLTETEKEALNGAIYDVNTEHGINIIVLTTDYLWNGLSIEGVADAAFREYGPLPNGAIFAICMNTRDWTVQGYGRVREVYTEDVLDRLEDQCIPLLSNGDYAEAFQTFAAVTDEAITLHDAGTPYQSPIPWGTVLLIGFGGGFAVALVVVLIMKGQLKSVRGQSAAKEYLKQGSLNVTVSRDLFLYNTMTRVPKPKSNSSGGGSRSGGGGRSGKF